MSEQAPKNPIDPEEERERLAFLRQLEDFLELPVMILGFFWLVLLVIELIWGLNPFLEAIVYVIWGIFVLDFALRFVLAPRKLVYLRRNWLTAISLLIPAVRVLQVFRIARALRVLQAGRGLRFVKVIASLNRGMNALRKTLGRTGFGYAIALTLIVALVGAAGMYAFENNPGGEGLNSYSDALWYTAMLLTTLGSDYWPVTGSGRLLTLVISIYAFAVFSYLTATLASFFIGPAENVAESAQRADAVQALRQEIQALREELRNANPPGSPPSADGP